MPVSITDFGAVADGRTNNHDAIQNAINYAQSHGDSVYIPTGTFAYSGTLTATGITVAGAGDGSILKALDAANQSLILQGDGGSLHDFQMQGNESAGRLTTWQSGMIWCHGATNFTVQNVHIVGSGSVGIAGDGASYGKILNNTIESTLADSIHMTNGTHHMTVTGNRIVHSGDDGIAVVSYDNQPISHDVLVQGNTVLYNDWGRGLSVVGGSNVQIVGNHVEGGTADVAGVYIAAESEWHTQGVSNVTVKDNTLIDCGGTKTGHGSILVYNSVAGSVQVTGVTLDHNQIDLPRAEAIQLTGAGSEVVNITNNVGYSDGHVMIGNHDSAASVTQSNNSMLSASSYPGAWVPAGGGVGTGTTSGTTTGGTTGGTTGASYTVSDTGTAADLSAIVGDATHPVSGTPTKFVTTLNTSAMVHGTDGNDQITGIQGQDTQGLAGHKGDDIYIVDNSADKVIENAGEGVDTVVLTAPSYTLAANVENLVVKGTQVTTAIGNDGNNIMVANDAGSKLFGGGGDDLMYGGKGADVLNGGAGNDTMKGGLSSDTYVVDSPYDKVVEYSNQGVDTVQSSISYKLGSYVENLTLTGTANINGTGTGWNNVLTGNDGNNVLSGGAGNDIISGGKGNDVLIGGTGNDMFVLKTPGTGVDTIKDFVIGQDNLNVHNIVVATGSATAPIALQTHAIEVIQNGANAEMYAHVGTNTYKVAVLENIHAADLVKTVDQWQ